MNEGAAVETAARKRPHAVLRPGSQLWSVFVFLRDRGAQGATSLELAEAFEGTNLNISTTAADIRKCARHYGYEMLPAKFEGKRVQGPSARKVYRYRLVRIGERPAEQPADQAPRDLFGDSRRDKW